MEDKLLLKRYLGGDRESLGMLVDKYRRTLYGYIVNMTQGQEDADEIFQEVWFRAIRKLALYRQKNFGGWLVRIAHNLIVDRSRRRLARRDAVPGMPVNVSPDGPGNPDNDPSREAAIRELGRQIEEAVRALPREQREVFVLRAHANLPFKSIAQIQGVSINTALARMQYALAKLRSRLQDAGREFGVDPQA